MKRLIGLAAVFMIMFTLPMQGQRKDLSGLKFCIDPGHGGHSSNDRPPVFSDIPFWESDGNYAKALLLKPMLEARGATVILTRYTNEYTNNTSGGDDEPSLSARYTVANQNNVNWFHSIHSNATGGTNTSSNYTLILLKENTSTRQAQWPEALIMSDRLWKQIQGHHRTASSYWVRTDYTFYGGPNGGFNLGVLNGAIMPCELSEGSFHDYQPEARRLMNNEYRKDEAYAICTAFMEYFGADYDTLGMISGSQTDPATGKGVSNGTIRLLPVDRVYHTDQYANGFFYFDSLAPGSYTVRYETPGYTTPDGIVTVTSNMPTVSGSTPSADALGVPRLAPFSITFLRPMDTAYVRSTLSITPAMPGTISWSNNNTVLTYTPTQPRPFKTVYTVSLNLVAKTPPSLSFVDNGTVTTSSLSAPYRFSFTTENLPPYISLTQPKANDTAFTVTKQIAIRFSDLMDTTIARKAFSIKPAVEGTFSWTNGGLNLFFTPAKPLPYSTTFTVTIDSTAKSLYGGTLDQNRDTVSNDTYSFTFRTAADPSTAVDVKDNKLPKEFALTQNFPNPFNPTTNFEVHVPSAGNVTVKVFDMLGREVATLVNERLAPGIYSYSMNASELASGVYFYRMQAGAFVQTKRMIVQK